MKILYTFDEEYALPCATSLTSLAATAPGSCLCDIAFFALNVRADTRRFVQSAAAVVAVRQHWYDIASHDLPRLPTGLDGAAQIFSLAAYLRLLADQLLPMSWQRVIYLDPDTFVARSLAGLWNADLHGAPLAAVLEFYAPTIGSPLGVQDWQRHGLRPDAPYVNSGVMVIDLCAWRRYRLGELAIRYALDNRDTILHLDQEALNACLNGNVKLLDPAWNVTSYWRKPERRRGRQRTILDRARIRHFTGPYKPWCRWQDECIHTQRYRQMMDSVRGTRPLPRHGCGHGSEPTTATAHSELEDPCM